MNFYDSLTFLWSFGQFFGTNYLISHYDELKITNKSLVIVLIFTVLSVVGVFIVIPEEDDYLFITHTTSILYIVIRFGVALQYMNTVFILVMSLIQRKQVFKFYKTVFDLDVVLQNILRVDLNYEKMRYKSCWQIFKIFGVYLVVTFIIGYFYSGNFTYIPILIIINFTDGSSLMSSVEYYYCTKIIQKRFKALNKLIIKSKKLKPNELEIMITCHYKLNYLICLINKIFGLKQLVSITNDFSVIIIQLYSFFISVENNFDDFIYMKFLSGSLMTPILVTKIVGTARCCQKTIALKKKFGKLLKKIEYLKSDGDVSILVCLIYEYVFDMR